MLPESGDIAWVDFDPVRGTEQAGRRPALVLSDRDYHIRSSRALVCPITSRLQPWPFNVPLPAGLKSQGAVLVDQIRSVHRGERMFGIIERAPEKVVAEVRRRLAALMGIEVVRGY